MLDPADPLTRAWLWLGLVAVLVVLVLRAIRRDRREFQRFKRYRTTRRRQATYRKWLRDSFLTFGGLAAVGLLLAGAFVTPLLTELQAWAFIRANRDFVTGFPLVATAIVLVVVVGLTVLTVIGVRAARTEGDVPAIGDIRAMLPRNRQELRLGALLSLNAGIVEELLFRLAIPALIFGASGSAIAAVVGSLVVFGALHAYQGLAGVIGTFIIGAAFMLAYAISGSILLAIVLHALVDLRTLVLIPAAVFGAHRVDGDATPVVGPLRAVAPAATASESAALPADHPIADRR